MRTIDQNMRYIDLTHDLSNSPYQTINQYGCGPNFVLNRLDSFEFMIKEQGLTFWFRFWLRFSTNPRVDVLQEINEKWPEKIGVVLIGIHKNFLEGSSDEAVQYCLGKLIMQLRKPKHKPPKTNQTAHLKCQFSELLQECVEMAFGAALCEAFSSWLCGPPLNENSEKTYWALPDTFLDPDFEARELEKFLVEYWKENLLDLLGIKAVRQIPWLLKWTTEWECALYKNNGDLTAYEDGVDMDEFIYLSPFLLHIAQITEVLKKHRNEVRCMIIKTDEVPDMAKIWNVAKLFSREKTIVEKGLRSEEELRVDPVTYDDTLRQRHQCSCCLKKIEPCSLFRVCKRCVAENWTERRYYCTDSCQMEHWFQKHHKEHIESMRKIANEIYSKNNDVLMASLA